jgi:hypothetical protein
MTENHEIPARKRRSSEEIKRLVQEFEASGLRQREFCRKYYLYTLSFRKIIGLGIRCLRMRAAFPESVAAGDSLFQLINFLRNCSSFASASRRFFKA